MKSAVDAIVPFATRPRRSCRVAAWTVINARRLATGLQHEGFEAISRLTPPPPSRPRDRAIAAATLWCLRASCLVRAAVLQRWDSEHGVGRALHIGVRQSNSGVQAHAWLDGDRVASDFSELHVRPSPSGN